MLPATVLCTKADLAFGHQLFSHGRRTDLVSGHNSKMSKTSAHFGLKPKVKRLQLGRLCLCNKARRETLFTTGAGGGGGGGGGGGMDSILERDEKIRKLTQSILWTAEGVYVLWLFLLPYAPGDPVWAISSETVNDLIGLSLNFFFILPLLNAAFLIPYMAIRLNKVNSEYPPRTNSQLGSIMTRGASIVGLVGGAACLLSTFWAILGRGDGDFGSISDRWEFLLSYLSSERLAYAFIWDICLYSIFQPWLIGDNLQNIQENKVGLVRYLSYVPVVGLVAYCLCLDTEEEY
ncbi:PREDICTED: uncharacterized protein LOC109216665 isoform X2 [Nicotiana attenuata]|uniref:uncharacterized protein LOC109216665 isoform X2 n=1 Tax=Nicotiana attenuata TaxID=49451 RepID=UPI000905078C|nr:PREDICTED: uncharacterized protein LOC109216665 isoform X2 [Nicotiana attenuata]